AFALISDVSILVSLHVLLLFHAISVPYRVMRSVTGSLFLQLRGKKYNPLRRRTDTYDFEVDQMLMGTLLFTVTVFLFPTLAVYYFYFALARGFIWLVQEGLVSATHITLYLPVYPVIYWALNRWKWPGGFAITTPKVTRVRYHANGTGSSPCTSITVEVTVVSKPLGLHIFLSDFLLVLKILSDRRPFRMLEVICQAQVWRNTNPLERLIPHLQKDCINAGICMQPASTMKTTTTATTKAAAAANTDTISASFTNASFVAETATSTTNAPSPSVTSSRH
ncbi:DNA-directed RNA polymerase II subunit 3, partial [Trypanosoma cruzi]